MNLVTRNSYPAIARILHWTSAAVILWAMSMGTIAAVFPNTSMSDVVTHVNVSITTLFLPIFVFRIVYRIAFCRRSESVDSGTPIGLAHAIHFLLYVATTGVLLSGVLMMESDIDIFSWFSVPRVADDPTINRLAAVVHRYGSVWLATLVGMHIGAVVWHEMFGRPVLRRMLSDRGN